MKSAGSITRIQNLKPKPVELVCETHGQYAGSVLELRGEKKYSNCPECKTIADQDGKEKQKIDREKQIKAGIPKRFLDRSFDYYNGKTDGQARALRIAQTYASNFDKIASKGGSLIMCGKPGTGKTHLACAIANQLLTQGRRVIFTSVIRAMRAVKETYNSSTNRTDQEVINGFTNVDLMILDEVGIQFGTEAEKIIMFEIINGRYENVMPTILISNLEERELGKYLGDRVIDRMREGGGAVIAFDWDSYRLQNTPQ